MKPSHSIIRSYAFLTFTGILCFAASGFAAEQEKKSFTVQGNASANQALNFNSPPVGTSQGKGTGPGGPAGLNFKPGSQDFLKVESFSHKAETASGGPAADWTHKNQGPAGLVGPMDLKIGVEHKNEIKNAFGSPLITKMGFPGADGASKEPTYNKTGGEAAAVDMFLKVDGIKGEIVPGPPVVKQKSFLGFSWGKKPQGEAQSKAVYDAHKGGEAAAVDMFLKVDGVQEGGFAQGETTLKNNERKMTVKFAPEYTRQKNASGKAE